MRRSVCAMLLVMLLACGDNGDNDVSENVCSEPESQLGYRVCVDRVSSDETWKDVAAEVKAVDQVRSTRYLVPARGDARLPTIIEDSNAGFQGHYQFLRTAFPKLFPTFTLDDYSEITQNRETREFYAGRLTQYLDASGDALYGFIVWSEQSELGTLRCQEAEEVYNRLLERVTLRPLVIVPTDDFQRSAWSNCAVPSYDAARAIEYEVYNPAKVIGRLRRYRLGELSQATREAEFGFQDILVIDQAPIDIETIVSGTVTGERQGELSHLNVRASSRGTANCYLRDAYDRLESWEGQLVSLTCGASELLVSQASEEEAAEFWDALRPDAIVIPEIDATQRALLGLLEIASSTMLERQDSLRTYGAKAKNLATLYQRIDSVLQYPGFAIPFAYYEDFMRDSGLAQVLDDMLSSDEFQSDAAVRRERLKGFRSMVKEATCSPQLLDDIRQEVDSHFGNSATMVRFRSSSNAEDTLYFNGAGLYRSTSVCAADDEDDNTIGPSLCDASKLNERGVCRGLKKVWASLWTSKAYNERSWYSIDHRKASMAVLVNSRSKDEQANIVAFTGNPFGDDDSRYLVNSQLGELEVVGEPGVSPEKVLLDVSPQDGSLQEIVRVRASSEVGAGGVVLDDLRLEQLATVLWSISEAMPIDEQAPEGTQLLLDTEWKITSEGRLVIKQVRPYLAQ